MAAASVSEVSGPAGRAGTVRGASRPGDPSPRDEPGGTDGLGQGFEGSGDVVPGSGEDLQVTAGGPELARLPG